MIFKGTLTWHESRHVSWGGLALQKRGDKLSKRFVFLHSPTHRDPHACDQPSKRLQNRACSKCYKTDISRYQDFQKGMAWTVFFWRFFGNSKQIHVLAEILRKRKILAELGQDFGQVRVYLQGFCLILAQFAYFSIVFA